MTTRHFLSLLDFTSDELRALIAHAIDVKQKLKRGIPHTPLAGKLLAMIFEKSSTRTRVSFEAGMYQLGGHAMFLSPRDSQLGRGEPIEDSARVISSMVDGILIRTFGHDRIVKLA
jgi:ornithine carbamoyltransferase